MITSRTPVVFSQRRQLAHQVGVGWPAICHTRRASQLRKTRRDLRLLCHPTLLRAYKMRRHNTRRPPAKLEWDSENRSQRVILVGTSTARLPQLLRLPGRGWAKRRSEE